MRHKIKISSRRESSGTDLNNNFVLQNKNKYFLLIFLIKPVAELITLIYGY